MIPAFFKALRERLAAQRLPFELVDEERLQSGPRSESHILLERDEAGDTWGAPRARDKRDNASLLYQRWIGLQATIYAQATCPNPGRLDHEAVADRIAKQLARGIRYVTKSGPEIHSDGPRFGSSRFLTKEQLGQTAMATWPGRIYVMPFQLEDGVFDTDWLDAPPDSVALGPGGIPVDTTLVIQGEQPGPPKGQLGATTELEETR